MPPKSCHNSFWLRKGYCITANQNVQKMEDTLKKVDKTPKCDHAGMPSAEKDYKKRKIFTRITSESVTNKSENECY
jgi:hypothetical protein